MRWVRRALFMLLPIALIAGGFWYISDVPVIPIVGADEAYVEASKLGITIGVSGVVKEVDVKEDQHVEAGQLLYRLDDLPFRLTLERAEAQVSAVRDDLNALKANYQFLRVQIKQAQDDVDYYLTELHRGQSPSNTQVKSQAVSDAAQRNLQNAQNKLASLSDQIAATTAELGGDPDIPFKLHPRYLDALMLRDKAARQLADTVVKAPFAGIVTNVSSIAPGTHLRASTPALYLIVTDHVWVDAKP
jgi:membrane fusion protein, multidrug efflux system